MSIGDEIQRLLGNVLEKSKIAHDPPSQTRALSFATRNCFAAKITNYNEHFPVALTQPMTVNNVVAFGQRFDIKFSFFPF